MVFDDHVETVFCGELAQLPQAIGGQLQLLVVTTARSRIDAQGMAAKELRRLHPLVVILDGLRAFPLVGISQAAFTIDHDQQALDTEVGRPLFQFAQVLHVPRLVLEKLVDVFHRVDPQFLRGDFGEVEMIDLAGEDRLV